MQTGTASWIDPFTSEQLDAWTAKALANSPYNDAKLDAANPLAFAKTAQTALEKLLSDCAADSPCHAAFPNLRDEFRDISARLDSGAVRVAVWRDAHRNRVPGFAVVRAPPGSGGALD